MILTERDLQFDFTQALQSRKFDDEEKHGLSHCMKAVDFIVELNDRLFFVEVKDPEHPSAPREERVKFIESFKSDELIKKHLVPKYRDSFIYEYSADRIHKPITYIVLIAIDSLDDAQLVPFTDELKKHLPFWGPPSMKWTREFVHSCFVMNLTTWRKHFAQFPVKRLSEN